MSTDVTNTPAEAPPGKDRSGETGENLVRLMLDGLRSNMRQYGMLIALGLIVALFAVWMLIFERSPWPTLTLIVSLEAIFLSTFVMIGQNRQAAFQQLKSDKDFQDVNTLLVENTNLTRTIHELTEELHRHVLGDAGSRS